MSTPYPGDTFWPTHFQKATITGKLVDLAGNPVEGTIDFIPSPARLVLIDDAVTVMPRTLSVTLEADGSFSLDVPATDDPNVSPVRWTYTVVENFLNVTGQSYPIYAPVGTTIDLSTAAPVSSSDGVYRYVGPQGPQGLQGPIGITGAADLGVVALSSGGVTVGKVPMATDATHADWEYPLGIPIAGTPGPAMWLSSDDDGLHARWAPLDAFARSTNSVSGTYVSPVGTRALWALVYGGGGGGSSGARNSITPGGGGGGGGGGLTMVLIRAADFANYGTDNGDGTWSFPFTIGAGGVGGASVTVNSTPGNNGTNGAMSTFGSGIHSITASGGLKGKGGALTTGSPGGWGGSGTTDGGDGGTSDVSTSGSTPPRMTGGPSGGGAGGSIDSLAGHHDGGDANMPSTSLTRGGAGGGGTGGSSGTDGVGALLFAPAQGGGGGASYFLPNVGDGGNGGSGGGGGGGGGSAPNGNATGAGGDGGVGRVVIVAIL